MGFALSTMKLRSSAFESGGSIPTRFTGEGEDVSPPLEWSDPPDGVESFALFCHDPDAPLVQPAAYGFVHWALAGIPGATRLLAEGNAEHVQGRTDFGRNGYGGPMPPEGHGRHHYFFWLLALSSTPSLEPGFSLNELLTAVEPHVIGMNRLVGVYERS